MFYPGQKRVKGLWKAKECNVVENCRSMAVQLKKCTNWNSFYKDNSHYFLQEVIHRSNLHFKEKKKKTKCQLDKKQNKIRSIQNYLCFWKWARSGRSVLAHDFVKNCETVQMDFIIVELGSKLGSNGSAFDLSWWSQFFSQKYRETSP